SIAAARAPRSTSAASVAWRSIGPGVVRLPASLGTASPAGSNAPSVPIEPVGSSADSTWRSSVTDVVLPFVPVTPTRSSFAAGRSYHASAATAAARRPARTRICSISTGCSCSTSAAAAPRARAAVTNSCPARTEPCTAQYNIPGAVGLIGPRQHIGHQAPIVVRRYGRGGRRGGGDPSPDERHRTGHERLLEHRACHRRGALSGEVAALVGVVDLHNQHELRPIG